MCCMQIMLCAQQVLEYEMYLSSNKWMVVYNSLGGWIWKFVQYMGTSSTVQKPVLTKWGSYLAALLQQNFIQIIKLSVMYFNKYSLLFRTTIK